MFKRVRGFTSLESSHDSISYVIQEARGTIVLAIQAYTSIQGALDKRYADVLVVSNLNNERTFSMAN